MKNNTLSVVISAFNEEKNIAACLESASFADEIIVVDSQSTDNTAKIARKYTKNIYKKENNLMLNINKNFGFTKATSDWILCLDADERITPELQKEIQSILSRHSGSSRIDSGVLWSSQSPQNDNAVNGYWIPRKNIIFGKWIQNNMWWPDYQLRLFRNGKGKFPEEHVHEYIHVQGETERLTSPMTHYNYDSVSQFLYKMDKIYTENEANNLIKNGKVLLWTDAIFMPVNDFIKTFFAQKGYKDGLHGLVLSILQALYMIVVFAKVWEKQGFKEQRFDLKSVKQEFKKMRHDVSYWLITSFIDETKNPLTKLVLRIKRRLHS